MIVQRICEYTKNGVSKCLTSFNVSTIKTILPELRQCMQDIFINYHERPTTIPMQSVNQKSSLQKALKTKNWMTSVSNVLAYGNGVEQNIEYEENVATLTRMYLGIVPFSIKLIYLLHIRCL